MTVPERHGPSRLEVTDFGPIVEAKLDLRPLTVFVGPGNAGKSYLATLIYALHRVLSSDTVLAGQGLRRVSSNLWTKGRPNLSAASVNQLLKLQCSLVGDLEEGDKRSVVLTPPVADTVRSYFDGLATSLSHEIVRCFGVGDPDALVRKGSKHAPRITMRHTPPDLHRAVQHSFVLSKSSEFATDFPEAAQFPLCLGSDEEIHQFMRAHTHWPDLSEADTIRRECAAKEFLWLIGVKMLPTLFNPLHLPAFYLPAGRTAVMKAHNAVINALIASAPLADHRLANQTPVLSGVLADFLEQLIEIGSVRHARNKTKLDLGKGIEASILEGSVRVDRFEAINHPHFVFRPRGLKKDLALANASSTVSELAPLVLCLRHIVEQNNVLILEEPESHLHPAMQVVLTRQLAALVEAGVRVIVTTHSEWLLEELANVVRRSQLPEAERDGQVALNPSQVGAWQFQPKGRPKGSIVKEICLDESGQYPSDFDEVAIALHNQWADISGRLEASS